MVPLSAMLEYMKLQTQSGKTVFPIGIGTWGIGGRREPEYGDEAAGVEAIKYALDKGQNLIDGAELYGGGHTDDIIGEAIKGRNRADLYLISKLWETNFGQGKAKQAVETVLKKLGTDYLDMLYIHWPNEGWEQAVPQINELIDAGVVKQFGISNFNLEQTKQALKLSKHPIGASQLHYSVLHKQDAPEELRSFCVDKGIQIVAYRPVERADVLNNETVQRIASARGISAVQVALAWLLAQDVMPIPKAMQKAHIDQNIAAVQAQLLPEDIANLNAL